MTDAVVFPSVRKPAKGADEYMMYDQSAESAGYKTDAEGMAVDPIEIKPTPAAMAASRTVLFW